MASDHQSGDIHHLRFRDGTEFNRNRGDAWMRKNTSAFKPSALECLAGLTYTLLMAFFGTLSGVIMRERVVSYVIGPLIIEERWNQKVPHT